MYIFVCVFSMYHHCAKSVRIRRFSGKTRNTKIQTLFTQCMYICEGIRIGLVVYITTSWMCILFQ